MALFSTSNIGLIQNKPDRCLKCGGKLRNRQPKDDKPRYRCQSCHATWERDRRGQLKETV
jgi:transposase-like protein